MVSTLGVPLPPKKVPLAAPSPEVQRQEIARRQKQEQEQLYHQEFQQYMEQKRMQQQMPEEEKQEYDRRVPSEEVPRQSTGERRPSRAPSVRVQSAHLPHSMSRKLGSGAGGILPLGRDNSPGFHRDIMPTNPMPFVPDYPPTRMDHHLLEQTITQPLRTQMMSQQAERHSSQPQRTLIDYGSKPLSYYTGRGVSQAVSNPKVYKSFVNKQRSVARASDIHAVAGLER
jgi:hypothetical protein